jgi:hypothetical protein
MTELLLESLPELARGDMVLRELRVFLHPDPPSGAPQISYVLRGTTQDGVACQGVLTGLRSSQQGARRALAVAAQLRRLSPDATLVIRVPEPVAAVLEPPVALFRFDPQRNLRQYLRDAADPGLPGDLAAAAAQRLRQFHESPLDLDEQESWSQVAAELHSAAADAAGRLDAAGERRSAERARALRDRLEAAAERVAPASAPIHGCLTWKNIVRSDDDFYLTGLERCRRSHPGLDVGGFLADLRRFCLLGKDPDPAGHRAARDLFLGTYSCPERPAWLAGAGFFEAAALLLRVRGFLEHADELPLGKIERILKEAQRLLE